jgi:hypothetical protein
MYDVIILFNFLLVLDVSSRGSTMKHVTHVSHLIHIRCPIGWLKEEASLNIPLFFNRYFLSGDLID